MCSAVVGIMAEILSTYITTYTAPTWKTGEIYNGKLYFMIFFYL